MLAQQNPEVYRYSRVSLQLLLVLLGNTTSTSSYLTCIL